MFFMLKGGTFICFLVHSDDQFAFEYCLAVLIIPPVTTGYNVRRYSFSGVLVASSIYLGFLAAGEEIEQPFGYDEVYFPAESTVVC
ncbi:MAG: hypothetical protein NXY57DRAFT_998423, partial [Lentinula lateritia]